MAENVGRGSLLEQALERGAPKRQECGVPKMLRENPKLREQIEELVAALPERVNYTVAVNILKEAGVTVSTSTLSRHNRRVCSCRS